MFDMDVKLSQGNLPEQIYKVRGKFLYSSWAIHYVPTMCFLRAHAATIVWCPLDQPCSRNGHAEHFFKVQMMASVMVVTCCCRWR